MPQIINPTATLGQLLGSGIGSGLNVLAQQKLGELASRHQMAQTSRGLEALGIAPQDASKIAGLSPQLQDLVVKNYLAAAESRGLDEALGALRGEPPTQQQQPAQALQNQKATGLEALSGSRKSAEIPEYNEPEARKERSSDFADLLKASRISPQEKIKLETLRQAKEFHKEKLGAKEQELVDKETKPVYDDISKGARAARNNNQRLDRMETLIKKGNLVGGAWGSILDSVFHGIFGFGFDLHTFLHPDSQEFRKLSNDFLKDAKDTFGSRLTNYDVKTFLSTVPTLSQTDAGKMRVIRNLRSFNDAALARKKAMDDIIKENGDKRPANLDTLVEERISPILDDLAKRFKEGEPGKEEGERNVSRSWLVPETLQVR